MNIDARTFLSKYNFSTLTGSLALDPQKMTNARRQFEGMTSSAFDSNTSLINAGIISYLQNTNPSLLNEYLGLYNTPHRLFSEKNSVFSELNSDNLDSIFMDYIPPSG